MNINRQQNRGFGRPDMDLSVNHIASKTISTNLLTAVEVIDNNVVAIEQDIYNTRLLLTSNTEDIMSNAIDIVQNEKMMLDLNEHHSLPWFNKSAFIYGIISGAQWSEGGSVPNDALSLFTRRVTLSGKFKNALVVLPCIESNVRHAAVTLESKKAAAFVTENPLTASRLTSFEFEWFPSEDNVLGDIQVGYATLFSKPPLLSNFLFGSDKDSVLADSKSVVFPSSGSLYVQSIYLDNTGPLSQLVLVGQKFNVTNNTTLDGFEYYGVT